MATIQRYVNTASTSGGDGTTNNTTGPNRAYASLSAWEAAMGAGNAADDYIVDCCGTAEDTTAVTLQFAANSVIIRSNSSDPAGRYTGNQLISTNHYRLRTTSSSVPITALLNNMTIDGIQVILANATTSLNGIEDGACTGATVVRNCRIVRDAGAGNGIALGIAGIGVGSANGMSRIYENNLIVGFAIGIRSRYPEYWTRTSTFRHNTIYGGGANSAGIVILDQTNTDCDYFIYGNAIANTGTTAGITVTAGILSTVTYADNACSVASGTTDEVVLGTPTDAWVSPGLSSTSDFTPKNTGALFAAVNPTRVTLDINNYTRDGASHDIGAVEYPAPPAPVLSSPTVTSITPSGATIGCTTNIGDGVLYSVVTQSATSPSVAQVKAGQNNAGAAASWSNSTSISSSGARTFNAVGLSPATNYYAYFVHTSAASADSTVLGTGLFTTQAVDNSNVLTSSQFTTLAPPDVTPPTLSSPTGTSTGSTTASGSVSTNEGNGVLYRLASVNSTELAATVKAANLTTSVSATGVQNVTFSGLTPSTQYYAHYVHTDSSGNDSARVSSSAFNTSAGADTTPPTLSSPTGTATGSTTASGSVSTNESNGTLYRLASTNATELAATVIAANNTTAVNSTGVQNVTFTGLTASTQYYAHYVHRDAAGNDSTRVSSTAFTTNGPIFATLTSSRLSLNNNITLRGQSFTGYVYNMANGQLVVAKTSLNSDNNGIVILQDAALTVATTYFVVWRSSTGGFGVETLTAA